MTPDLLPGAPATDPGPTRRRLRITRRHVIFIVAVALLLLGAVAIVLGVVQYLRSRAEDGQLAFAPAQEGEFLIIIAPFLRQGDESAPIGGTLANDLRETPHPEDLYRVETLERAPRDRFIPGIVEAYSPAALTTGSYDGDAVLADVRLYPPGLPPLPPATDAAGAAALLPNAAPVEFHIYAPQANEKPLRYLQSWLMAQSHFWAGQYDEAAEFLLEALRLRPRDLPTSQRGEQDLFEAFTNSQLGFIAGGVHGNWPAARDFYGLALRQNPDDPIAAVGLAAALTQTGQPAEAQSLLLEALRRHPDSWQIHVALGQLGLQQGDVEGGLAAYDRAIALLDAGDPVQKRTLADIYFDRGYYRLTHNDASGALSDLQKTVELGRAGVHAQSSLAWAAYLSGDYATAVKASAVAAQLQPDQPDLAFDKALLLLAASQIDDANSAYDEAVAVTLRLDDVLTRSRYFGGAFRDLEQLLQRRPDLEQDIRAIQQRIDIANG